MTKKTNTNRNRSSENNEEVKVISEVISLDTTLILDRSKYHVKNNANRFLTTEMFDDHPDNRRLKNKISPYSLFNDEHVRLDSGEIVYSMKKIYLNLNDDTGYLCAMTCLGSIEHWEKLLENSVIKNEIDKWKRSLELKQLALTKQACYKEIESKGKGAMQAARLLIQLNNQDPNSRSNIEKKKVEEVKNNKEGYVEEEDYTSQEHLSMLEDLKRLNG